MVVAFFSIQIMDCPGLFDTGKTNEEVAERFLNAFSQLSGTDVICYVIEISGFTEEDYGSYQRLKAMLDDRVTSYLLLIFTHGDRLKGSDIRSMLNKAPASLQRILQDCGGRHVVFDNTSSNPQEQVQQLIHIARQMKSQNGGKLYTCSSNASSGLTARLSQVDQTEADKSLYVQRLQASVKQAEHSASSTCQDLARKTQEREAAMKRQEVALQQQVNEVSAKVNQQKASCSSLTSQLQALRDREVREQQQQNQELQQLQSQQAAAMQQKNNEIASLR